MSSSAPAIGYICGKLMYWKPSETVVEPSGVTTVTAALPGAPGGVVRGILWRGRSPPLVGLVSWIFVACAPAIVTCKLDPSNPYPTILIESPPDPDPTL